jgi:predicted phage terminase large subunit-like protein
MRTTSSATSLAGAVGSAQLPGDRRKRRGAPDRDDLGTALLPAAPGRGVASRTRAAGGAPSHPARTIGEHNFAGQWQQSPTPLGGGLVKTEWFKRHRDSDKPECFDRIVQSWDTANKATELSDYSVCTTWGVKGKHLFLIGLFRRRLEYPALKRAVREQQTLFNAGVVLIEDKASGTQLIQDLSAEGCHGVTRYQPTEEKTMRMHAQTAVIENGFVHLPENAPWLAEYLHELAVFPNGKHDDQADSTAQFLDWFKTPFPGQNMYELYQRDSEKGRRRTRSWVWLQAPPGIGAVQTLHSRQHLTVGLDRTVEMWVQDAQYLIPAGWIKLAEWTTDQDAAAERSKPRTMPQPGPMEWFEAQKKKG